MFVEITNIGISPIRVDGEIKKRRNNLGMFAPDIAMYALSCSNHYANMNVVIGNIKRRPENEWQFYKEFVLSAVCGRKHRNSVFEDLRNFAKIGGYEEEFEIYTYTYVQEDVQYTFFCKDRNGEFSMYQIEKLEK